MDHPKTALALVLAFGVATMACTGTVPLPRAAVQLNATGALALAQGDLSTAEARLSVALEYSPRFVEAWVNLGYVELRRGNFVQARRDFLRARELNEDLPAPHHALGVLDDEEGEGARAEDHYRAALRVDPGFAPARANLARLLYARGQYENAREQFQRLVQVAPNSVQGWAGEAECLLRLGREGDAASVVAHARARPGKRAGIGNPACARANPVSGIGTTAGSDPRADRCGRRDRIRAAAAWAWIAVARIGKLDRVGARQAAEAALAIHPGDAVAAYALRLSEGAEWPSPQGPR